MYRVLRMRTMSKKLGDVIHATNKNCFMNSVKVMTLIPKQIGIHDVTAYYYTEGVVVDRHNVLYCHGWIEVALRSRKTGTRHTFVLDPTPAYHANNHKTKYFAARRWTLGELQARISDSKIITLPLVGVIELRDPAYAKAYDEAHVHVYGVPLKDAMTRLVSVKEAK